MSRAEDTEWILELVNDTGIYSSCCAICKRTIRYTFRVRNSEDAKAILVGRVCAETLTNDYLNPKRLLKEERIRKRNEDRAKDNFWAAWRVAPNGNEILIFHGTVYTIFKDKKGFLKLVHDNTFEGPFYHKDEIRKRLFNRLL